MNSFDLLKMLFEVRKHYLYSRIYLICKKVNVHVFNFFKTTRKLNFFIRLRMEVVAKKENVFHDNKL